MRSNFIELNLRNAVEGLAAMKPALSSSIGRFARGLEGENRRVEAQPRIGRPSTRLPGPPGGRVAAYRGGYPQRLRSKIPPTVVQRERMRGGSVSPAQAIRDAVARLPDLIRNQLNSLHNGLGNVQRRMQVRTRVVQSEFNSAPRRAPPLASREGPLTSWLAIVAATAIGLSAIADGAKSLAPSFVSPVPDERVGILAQAIAMAEGYYAPGARDGRSLPYLLNNPGSLKKPALGAGSLPTWKDTGLIVFPTKGMGWDALNHQVKLMVTGNSSIYDLSDSILDVASKYADGDLNWGRNVARNLGISPSCTLGEIAASHPNCLLTVDAREPDRLQLAENAPETAIEEE